MWVEILLGICLTIVFGLVIWNIIYTVTQLKDLHAQMNTRQWMDAAQNRKLLSTDDDVQSINASLSDTGLKLKDYDERLQKIESSDKTQNTTLTQLRQQDSQHLSRVSALESSTSNLELDFQGLSQRTGQLEASTSSLDSSYMRLKNDMASIFDASNNKLMARQLCLDATCISQAQLLNISPAQVSLSTTIPPASGTTDTNTNTNTTAVMPDVTIVSPPPTSTPMSTTTQTPTAPTTSLQMI
jgi:uncharacterized protein (DUF3084 family)